jgi:hypothetical protein
MEIADARVERPLGQSVEAMSPQNPLPNFDDPNLLTALAQAFESTWLVMRAHEPLVDADRAKELQATLSKRFTSC